MYVTTSRVIWLHFTNKGRSIPLAAETFSVKSSFCLFKAYANIRDGYANFYESFFQIYVRLSSDVVRLFVRNTNKKAQLSLTNPRNACEKLARFT